MIVRSKEKWRLGALRIGAAILVLAPGCARIAQPVANDAEVADGGVVDAPFGDGAPVASGPCEEFTHYRSRGIRIYVDSRRSPAARSAYSLTATSGVTAWGAANIEAFAAAGGGRAEIVQAGEGAEASLATCTRCVAVRTRCVGAVCSGPTYVLTHGIMGITTDGAVAGDGFQLEGENLIFRPANVDPISLETTVDFTGGCVAIDHFVVSGTIVEVSACDARDLLCARAHAP